MTTSKAVVVIQLPEKMVLNDAQEFFREVEPLLKCDRPALVFDFSGVRHLDSAGIEMLLRSLEEAIKRNGDLKLAAIPARLATILELTRIDRLFEIFENSSDAVESFHRFPVQAFSQSTPPWYSRPCADKENPAVTSS